MTLYARFAAHLDAALDTLVADGTLPSGLERRAVTVEPPRDPSHGDLATNAAMVLAKPAGANPRALAERIAAELGQLDAALTDFDRALALDPALGESLVARAAVHCRAGRRAEALADLKSAAARGIPVTELGRLRGQSAEPARPAARGWRREVLRD